MTLCDPLTTLNTPICTFCIALCIFVIGDHKNFKFDVQVECASLFTAYGRQTVPDRDVVRSCDPLQNFWGSNHITGTAELKVVKVFTQVGYINSSNGMTYHPQKGCGYGHVTVLKFCCLLWCSASRGFVRDSWATCHISWLEIKNFSAIGRTTFESPEHHRTWQFDFLIQCGKRPWFKKK